MELWKLAPKVPGSLASHPHSGSARKHLFWSVARNHRVLIGSASLRVLQVMTALSFAAAVTFEQKPPLGVSNTGSWPSLARGARRCGFSPCKLPPPSLRPRAWMILDFLLHSNSFSSSWDESRRKCRGWIKKKKLLNRHCGSPPAWHRLEIWALLFRR